MLYYISIFAFVVLLVMRTYHRDVWRRPELTDIFIPVPMYHYRAVIILRLPDRAKAFLPRISHYRPLPTFSDQISVGLSSSAFDIEANVQQGDSRAGLDEQGVQEVMEIMRRERVKWVLTRIPSRTGCILTLELFPALTRRG
jgi:hypothetical protein